MCLTEPTFWRSLADVWRARGGREQTKNGKIIKIFEQQKFWESRAVVAGTRGWPPKTAGGRLDDRRSLARVFLSKKWPGGRGGRPPRVEIWRGWWRSLTGVGRPAAVVDFSQKLICSTSVLLNFQLTLQDVVHCLY